MVKAFVAVALGLQKSVVLENVLFAGALIEIGVYFERSLEEACKKMTATCTLKHPERAWDISLCFAKGVNDTVAEGLYPYAQPAGEAKNSKPKPYIVAALATPKGGGLSAEGFAYSLRIEFTVDRTEVKAKHLALSVAKKDEPEFDWHIGSVAVKLLDEELALQLVTYATPR